MIRFGFHSFVGSRSVCAPAPCAASTITSPSVARVNRFSRLTHLERHVGYIVQLRGSGGGGRMRMREQTGYVLAGAPKTVL